MFYLQMIFCSNVHFFSVFVLYPFLSFIADSTKAQSRDLVGFVWTWPLSSFCTKKLWSYWTTSGGQTEHRPGQNLHRTDFDRVDYPNTVGHVNQVKKIQTLTVVKKWINLAICVCIVQKEMERWESRAESCSFLLHCTKTFLRNTRMKACHSFALFTCRK